MALIEMETAEEAIAGLIVRITVFKIYFFNSFFFLFRIHIIIV
jgi:hypothetical protein